MGQSAQQQALSSYNQSIIQQAKSTGGQPVYVNPNVKQPPMITPKMGNNMMIGDGSSLSKKHKKSKIKKPKLDIPVDEDEDDEQSSDGDSSSTTLSPVRRDRSA